MSSLKQEEFEPEPINGTIPPIRVWMMAPLESGLWHHSSIELAPFHKSHDASLLLYVYRVDSNVTTDCLAGFTHWNENNSDSDGVNLTGTLLYTGTTLLQGNTCK